MTSKRKTRSAARRPFAPSYDENMLRKELSPGDAKQLRKMQRQARRKGERLS